MNLEGGFFSCIQAFKKFKIKHYISYIKIYAEYRVILSYIQVFYCVLSDQHKLLQLGTEQSTYIEKSKVYKKDQFQVQVIIHLCDESTCLRMILSLK